MPPGWLVLNEARIIALSRLLVAVTVFMLSATDPMEVGFQLEPDDLAALAFLAYAIAALGIAWRYWKLDFRLGKVVQTVDLAAFVILPPLIEPWGSGYRVASLILGAYLMLVTAVRWNWRHALGVGIALNVVNLAANSIHYGSIVKAGSVFDATIASDYIRNLLIMVILTVFILVYARSFSNPAAAAIAAPARVTDLDLGRQDALCAAVQAARAGGGRLYWLATTAADVEFYHTGSACPPDLGTIPAQFDQLSNQSRPAIFEIHEDRAVSLWPDGLLRTSTDEERRRLKVLGCGRAICSLVPISGSSGTGILVFADIPAPCAGTLRAHVRLAAETALELDRLAFHEAARLAADTRLRNEVACELHDGVAQSLAGARFWLASLNRVGDKSPQFAATLDQALAALASESAHVRQVIATLRAEPSLEGPVDLAVELADFVPEAARTWNLATRLEAAPGDWTVTRGRLFEVQQLVRECFSNAARHGLARNAVVRLLGTEDRIVLEVEDDGVGAAGEGATPRAIGDRCRRLGGGVEFRSQSGQTVVRMSLPTETPHESHRHC